MNHDQEKPSQKLEVNQINMLLQQQNEMKQKTTL